MPPKKTIAISAAKRAPGTRSSGRISIEPTLSAKIGDEDDRDPRAPAQECTEARRQQEASRPHRSAGCQREDEPIAVRAGVDDGVGADLSAIAADLVASPGQQL